MRAFFNQIARERGITNLSDWHRVTSSFIKEKGGYGILKRYSGSLMRALREVYTEYNWDGFVHSIDSPLTKPERIILDCLKGWTKEQMFFNYKHPGLMNLSSTKGMELDVYLPRLKLGFEYQGPHHYKEVRRFAVFHKKLLDVWKQ